MVRGGSGHLLQGAFHSADGAKSVVVVDQMHWSEGGSNAATAAGKTCYFLCLLGEDKGSARMKTANMMSHDREEPLVLFVTGYTEQLVKASDLLKQVGVDVSGMMRSGSCNLFRIDQA